MSQYNTFNVKLSNSQLNKLKSRIKKNTEVALKISSNIAGGSNNDTNFLHKLLLTNTQVSKLPKALANNYLANAKLSKTQLHKIGQLGGFLGKLLGPLLKLGLALIWNVLKTLAKSSLTPLWLTGLVSAKDAAIHKKMFGSRTTSLSISNEEINIMKIVKSRE